MGINYSDDKIINLNFNSSNDFEMIITIILYAQSLIHQTINNNVKTRIPLEFK